MRTPQKKQKKFIVVDFDAEEVPSFFDLDAIKGYIQHRTDESGQNADWATNNFVVFEIKEHIVFTAQEKLAINFGIG